ncbi:MAG: DUF3501 family protein [Chromatiales bacterium]
MQKLGRADLWSLEEYAKMRQAFRAQVIAHKRSRQLALGDHVTLYFEDRLTIQYQIQEMLRIERIFEEAEIQGELDAYNPLIPDGSNLKATLMVEYPDLEERTRALAQLLGIERKIWLQVDGHQKIWPVADEDLERTTTEKTASVHFLRFEFSPGMVRSIKNGAAIAAAVEHPNYRAAVSPIPEPVRNALAVDLDPA